MPLIRVIELLNVFEMQLLNKLKYFKITLIDHFRMYFTRLAIPAQCGTSLEMSSVNDSPIMECMVSVKSII